MDLKLTSEEVKHWIEPIIIDTKKDAEMFFDALEKAAAAKHKDIDVNYREVTDIDEIKRIFNQKKHTKVECWETSCLNNSACDAFETIADGNPYCLECKEDCPNKIVMDF